LEDAKRYFELAETTAAVFIINLQLLHTYTMPPRTRKEDKEAKKDTNKDPKPSKAKKTSKAKGNEGSEETEQLEVPCSSFYRSAYRSARATTCGTRATAATKGG